MMGLESWKPLVFALLVAKESFMIIGLVLYPHATEVYRYFHHLTIIVSFGGRYVPIMTYKNWKVLGSFCFTLSDMLRFFATNFRVNWNVSI